MRPDGTAESLGGCGGVVVPEPPEPSPDEVSWRPLVPVGIPGRGAGSARIDVPDHTSYPPAYLTRNRYVANPVDTPALLSLGYRYIGGDNAK